MAVLPFVFAVAAAVCVHTGAYAWAVGCALFTVTFAIIYGADLIADTLEELD